MLSKKQSLTEKILKGSSIVLAFTLLGSPVGYLTRVLYSNSLSIEMFGLFYAVLAFFSLLSMYLDFGLGFSCSYFIPKFIKKVDKESVALIFQYTQIAEVSTTILFSVVLFFSAHWLSVNYFKTLEAINLIYIFSIYLIANSIFTTLNSLFLGFQKEIYYSSMQFFRMFFVLSFSIFLWLFNIHNVVFYSIAWTAGTLAVVTLYYGVVLRSYPFIFRRPSWNGKLLKSMVSYGVPTLVTASIYTFITSTDTLFLTFFHGLRDVGVYNVVYPLATISGIFLSPINALILPLISHLMEGEEEKVSELIHNILKLVPFVSLYFGLFIALFPTAIATTLFGVKWTGLIEEPLILFSIGFVMAPLSTLLVTVLSGMGKVKERLKLSAIIAFLNIILSLILIPKYGVIGAVIANSAVYLLSVLLMVKTISNFLTLRYPFGFYAKLLLFSLSTFLAVKFFVNSPTSLLQIIIYGLVYSAAFAVFAFTQKVLDSKAMDLIFARVFRKHPK